MVQLSRSALSVPNRLGPLGHFVFRTQNNGLNGMICRVLHDKFLNQTLPSARRPLWIQKKISTTMRDRPCGRATENEVCFEKFSRGPRILSPLIDDHLRCSRNDQFLRFRTIGLPLQQLSKHHLKADADADSPNLRMVESAKLSAKLTVCHEGRRSSLFERPSYSFGEDRSSFFSLKW